jgi:uncharacterized membrane protein YeiH
VDPRSVGPVGDDGRRSMEGAEIAGTVVFAISGVIAVAERPLDWLDEFTAISEPVSATAGGLAIFGLRMVGIRRQWSLPQLTRA